MTGRDEERNQHYEHISLWRNYRRGTVVIQAFDRPELHLTPDEARQRADQTERKFEASDLSDRPSNDVLFELLSDIRDYADELEQLEENDD